MLKVREVCKESHGQNGGGVCVLSTAQTGAP